MILPGSSIMQMAWVVEDLDEAIVRFSRIHGAGPFLVNRHIKIVEPRYRGHVVETDFSTAIAQAGAIQLELVHQHDDSPSIYRDIYPRGREGFHHVAVVVPDVSAEVARYRALGFDVAFEGKFAASAFAYVDTSAALGHMVEILPDDATIGRFFAAIRKAAETWDGKDPVRELTAPPRPSA